MSYSNLLCSAFLLLLPLLPVFGAAAGNPATPAWQVPEMPWRIQLEQPDSGEPRPVQCEIAPDWKKLTEAAGSAVTPETVRLFHGDREVPLQVRQEDGKIRLRFCLSAPAAGNPLRLYFGGPARRLPAAPEKNLLAGALAPDSVGQWHGTASATATKEGILFTAPLQKRAKQLTISRDFPLPPGAAGRSAILELSLQSQAKLPWGGSIRIRQLDAKNRELPESVTDPRWISLMRPPRVWSHHSENGRIDPRAKKLRVVLRFRAVPQAYDLRGLPLENRQDAEPRLLVNRLELRIAQELPFPGWNNELFAPGVSGKAGDTAFRFDGISGIFFPLASQSLWAEGTQPPPSEWFWPAGDGTVEAWIFPEWKPNDAPVTLFDAWAWHRKKSRNSLFTLSFAPKKQEMTLYLKDFRDRVFRKRVKCPLPAGKWHHLAAQWSNSDGVRLFVDGKCLLHDPAWKFAPLEQKNLKEPDTRMALQFSLGYPGKISRNRFQNQQVPGFKGRMDRLLIRSEAFYHQNFTPSQTGNFGKKFRVAFDFDRSFDGRAGDGDARITGTVIAATPRIADTMIVESHNGEKREIRLRPAENSRRNTPEAVLQANNYPVLPVTADFRRLRRTEQKTFQLQPGESAELTLPQQVWMDSVELALPEEAEPLVHPIVLNDGEVDPRSFADIAESMNLAHCPERDRADRIFQLLLRSSDYFMSHQIGFDPGSDRPLEVTYQALHMLNGYCAFECGPLNNLAANLFCCSGNMPATQTFGYAHSFEQVFYDGKLHLYDLSAQKFFPSTDRESAASLRELETELLPFGLVTPPHSADHFIRLFQRTFAEHVPSLLGRSAFTLRPGERFRIWFCNDGGYNDLQSDNAKRKQAAVTDMTGETHAASPVWQVDRIFPHYSNAYLHFDGKPQRKNPAFFRWSDKGFSYRVALPYPIISGRFRAERNGQPVPMELSTDRGRTWRPVKSDAAGNVTLDYAIRARYEFELRVNASPDEISAFHVETRVMLNSRLLTGVLRPGRNRLRLKADSGSRCRVTLQYRCDTGSSELRGGVCWGAIRGWERQLVLLPPGRTEKLPLSGIAPDAVIRATPGLHAARSGEFLQLELEPKTPLPFFGNVTLTLPDGSETSLTVLAAPNARLVTADTALLENGAQLVPVTATRGNPCARLEKVGARVKFRFAPLPAGNYLVMTLHRVPAERQLPNTGRPRVAEFDLLRPDGKRIPAGWGINPALDFYKAKYGSGMSRFKWDGPIEGKYPYQQLQTQALPELDSLVFEAKQSAGTELAAVLILPAPSREFLIELQKTLCGLNYDPWRIAAGQSDTK